MMNHHLSMQGNIITLQLKIEGLDFETERRIDTMLNGKPQLLGPERQIIPHHKYGRVNCRQEDRQ